MKKTAKPNVFSVRKANSKVTWSTLGASLLTLGDAKHTQCALKVDGVLYVWSLSIVTE